MTDSDREGRTLRRRRAYQRFLAWERWIALDIATAVVVFIILVRAGLHWAAAAITVLTVCIIIAAMRKPTRALGALLRRRITRRCGRFCMIIR